jgi:cytochrome c oxidase subunit 2
MKARRSRPGRPWPELTRTALVAAVMLGLAVAAAACGSSSGAGADDDGEANPVVAEGKRIAAQRGCAGCHTPDGRPSVGPTWKGIVGTTVLLNDGSTAIVDQAYLERSMREPSAQVVAGFSVPMPRIPLGDDEVASLVEYIRSLS